MTDTKGPSEKPATWGAQSLLVSDLPAAWKAGLEIPASLISGLDTKHPIGCPCCAKMMRFVPPRRR